MKNIETNGPANIIMLLDAMLEYNKIPIEGYRVLKRQAELTIDYIKLLENPSNVKWHDVTKRGSK
jgi:hypothetical protein